MKIYWKIILGLLLLCFNSSLMAQPSDLIKYYIAFDRSGSVDYLDKNSNLQNLLKELIKLSHKGELNSNASVQLFTFGADSLAKEIAAFLPAKKGELNHKKLGDDIISATSKEKGERFTHVHAAFRSLINAIELDMKKQGPVARAVFLFTDGAISAAMVDPNLKIKQDQYMEILKGQIEEIQALTGKPVIIVQSSREPINVLLPAIGLKKAISSRDRKYLQEDNFFWISSDIKYEKKPPLDSAFRGFVDFVNHLTITNSGAHPNEAIESALAYQQLLAYLPIFAKRKEAASDSAIIIDNAIKRVPGQMKAEIDTVRDVSRKLIKPDTSSIKRNALVEANARMNFVKQLLDQVNKSNKSATKEFQTFKKEVIHLQSLLDKSALTKTELTDLNITLINLSQFDSLLTALKDVASKQYKKASFSLAKVYNPQPIIDLKEASSKNGTGTFQEKMILGLTDYVIDRAKQEAIYTFIENINDKVFNSKNIKFRETCRKYIFPETYALITLDNYASDLFKLKNAFKKDISNLPNSIIKADSLQLTDGLTALCTFTIFYKNLLFDQSMEAAFRKLDSDLDGLQKMKLRFKNGKVPSIILALQFTTKLIGNLDTYNFVNIYRNYPSQLHDLSKMLIAISLENAQLLEIEIDRAAFLVEEIFRDYTIVRNQVEEFISLLNDKPTSDYEEFRRYQYSLVSNILEKSSKLLLSGTEVLKYTKIDVNIRNLDSVAFTVTRVSKKAIDAWFEINDGKYAEAAFSLAPEIISALNLPEHHVLESLLNVAGEASQAQSPSDVKKIIARYALPVASYKVKRTSSHTIMFNSYAGLGTTYYFQDRAKPAITAPIGLEWSFRFFLSDTNFSTLSFMASLIDIGNIVNYRLFDRELEDDAVKFKNIISPGAFAVLGLSKRWPLAIIGGYQMNPKRVTAGLTVDMPLAAVFKKNRKAFYTSN